MSFDAGDGSGSMSAMNFTYGTARNLTPFGFTAPTGKHFDHWSGSNGLNYADEAEVNNLTTTNGGNVTLTAVYAWNTYTVSFSAGSGGAVSSSSIASVPYGSAITVNGNKVTINGTTITATPDSATDEFSYAFNSWSNVSGTITGARTITASFTQSTREYSVSFGVAAGSTGYGTVSSASIASVPYGSTITVSSNTVTINGTTITAVPTGDTAQYHYAFTGWNVSNGATTTSSTSITASFSRTTKEYDVSFNLQGHGDAISKQTIAYGSKVTAPTPAPTAAGYGFGGWYKEAGCVNAWDFASDTVTGTRTLYAKWTAYTYTIVFNKNNNDATGTMDNLAGKTVESSGTITPNAFELTGYTFIGWNTAPNGSGTDISDGAAYSAIVPTSNDQTITLYAQWQACYRIIYNDGYGVSPATSTQYVPLTENATAKAANTFSRTGYTFAYWSKTKGGVKAYDAGATISEYSSNTAETTPPVLYAVWTANTYTITFANGNVPSGNSGSVSIPVAEVTYDSTYGAAVRYSDHSTAYWPNGSTSGMSAPTGYSFAGWYKENSCTNLVSSSDTVNITANSTFYAKWTPNKYSVTIAAGTGVTEVKLSASSDGTGLQTSPHSFDYDSTVYGYIKIRAGFSAPDGWTSQGDYYKKPISVNSTSGVSFGTVNAVANTYRIVYNTAGGNAIGNGTYTVAAGSQNKALTEPTKSGYDFGGYSVTGQTSGSNSSASNTTLTIPAYAYGDVTVTAAWDVHTYTISYTMNGGTSDPVNPTTYTILSSAINLTNPTRTGYTFKGWSGTDLTGDSNKSVTIAAGSTGDRSFTANWTAITYEVSFDANGGSGSMSNQSLTYDSAEDLDASTFSKTGYSFAGWNTADDGSGTPYANAEEVLNLSSTQDAVIELFAQWTPNKYSVTIAAGTGVTEVKLSASSDGTGLQTSPHSFDYDSTVYGYIKIRAGFSAPDGWTSQGDYYKKPISVNSTSGVSFGTVNAVANTYRIVYNTAGGNAIGNGTYTVAAGSQNKALTEPTKSGYDFGGYSVTGQTSGSNSSASNTTLTIPAYAYGDVTVTAAWDVHTYTISYTMNGGTSDPVNPTTYTILSSAINLTNPTRTGYTFKGWSGTDLTGDSNKSVTIAAGSTGDRSFTANWTADTFTIAFDANGGSGTTASVTATYGQTRSLTANGFTRLGYDFQGWATSASGEKVHNNSAVLTQKEVNDYYETEGIGKNGILTLFAVWSVHVYSISYQNMSGATHTNVTTYTILDAVVLSDPSSNKAGYTFDGWFTTSALSGVATTGFAAGQTGDKTFYARWERTITLNRQKGDGGLTNVTAVFGLAMPNAGAAPTRYGYSFGGYYTSTNGSGIQYYNSSMVSMRNCDFSSNNAVTLYAKWTPNATTFGQTTYYLVGSDFRVKNSNNSADGWTSNDMIGNTTTPNTGDHGKWISIEFDAGALFKGVYWNGSNMAGWYSTIGAEDHSIENGWFGYESDGKGGNNIKCLVAGTYDVFLNGSNNFYITKKYVITINTIADFLHEAAATISFDSNQATSVTPPTIANYVFAEWHLGTENGPIWTDGGVLSSDITIYGLYTNIPASDGYYLVGNSTFNSGWAEDVDVSEWIAWHYNDPIQKMDAGEGGDLACRWAVNLPTGSLARVLHVSGGTATWENCYISGGTTGVTVSNSTRYDISDTAYYSFFVNSSGNAYILKTAVYTITLNGNGGTSSQATVRHVEHRTTDLSPYYATKAGKVFGGWAEVNNAGLSYTPIWSVDAENTQNRTFYAIWLDPTELFASGETYYLIVSDAWKGGNAVFYLWLCNGPAEDTWVAMQHVESTNLYYCTLPSSGLYWRNMLYTRQSPNGSPSWSDTEPNIILWNQTGDFTRSDFSSNNCVEITTADDQIKYIIEGTHYYLRSFTEFAEGEEIYLKPSDGWKTQTPSNYKYALYLFAGTGGAPETLWVDLDPVYSDGETVDYYSVTLPSSIVANTEKWLGGVFVRLAANASKDGSGNYSWTGTIQTVDLYRTTDTEICYVITGSGDRPAGSWTVLTNRTAGFWYLVGSAAGIGAWDLENTTNVIAGNTVANTDVEAGNHAKWVNVTFAANTEFKIVKVVGKIPYWYGTDGVSLVNISGFASKAGVRSTNVKIDRACTATIYFKDNDTIWVSVTSYLDEVTPKGYSGTGNDLDGDFSLANYAVTVNVQESGTLISSIVPSSDPVAPTYFHFSHYTLENSKNGTNAVSGPSIASGAPTIYANFFRDTYTLTIQAIKGGTPYTVKTLDVDSDKAIAANYAPITYHSEDETIYDLFYTNGSTGTMHAFRATSTTLYGSYSPSFASPVTSITSNTTVYIQTLAKDSVTFYVDAAWSGDDIAHNADRKFGDLVICNTDGVTWFKIPGDSACRVAPDLYKITMPTPWNFKIAKFEHDSAQADAGSSSNYTETISLTSTTIAAPRIAFIRLYAGNNHPVVWATEKQAAASVGSASITINNGTPVAMIQSDLNPNYFIYEGGQTVHAGDKIEVSATINSVGYTPNYYTRLPWYINRCVNTDRVPYYIEGEGSFVTAGLTSWSRESAIQMNEDPNETYLAVAYQIHFVAGDKFVIYVPSEVHEGPLHKTDIVTGEGLVNADGSNNIVIKTAGVYNVFVTSAAKIIIEEVSAEDQSNLCFYATDDSRLNFYIYKAGDNNYYLSIAGVPMLGNGYYIMDTADNGDSTVGFKDGLKMVTTEDGRVSYNHFHATAGQRIYVGSYVNGVDSVVVCNSYTKQTPDGCLTVTQHGALEGLPDTITFTLAGYYSLAVVNGAVVIYTYDATGFFTLGGLDLDSAASIQSQKTALILEVEFTLSSNAPMAISVVADNPFYTTSGGNRTYFAHVALYVKTSPETEGVYDTILDAVYEADEWGDTQAENCNDATAQIAPTNSPLYAYIVIDWVDDVPIDFTKYGSELNFTLWATQVG